MARGSSELGKSKHLDGAADGPQRIPKLVREHRQKLILGLTLALDLRQRPQIRDDHEAVFDLIDDHGADGQLRVDRRFAAVDQAGAELAVSLRRSMSLRVARSGSSTNCAIDVPIMCCSGMSTSSEKHRLQYITSPASLNVTAPSCICSTSARYGRVGAMQRVHAVPGAVTDEQRVDLPAADRPKGFFRLGQASPQVLDLEGIVGPAQDVARS